MCAFVRRYAPKRPSHDRRKYVCACVSAWARGRIFLVRVVENCVRVSSADVTSILGLVGGVVESPAARLFFRVCVCVLIIQKVTNTHRSCNYSARVVHAVVVEGCGEQMRLCVDSESRICLFVYLSGLNMIPAFSWRTTRMTENEQKKLCVTNHRH